MLRHGRFSNGGTTIAAAMVLVVALFLQRGGAQTTSTEGSSSNPDGPNPYNYTRFSPSMAIILVIFIVVVFMMGFFAVYIRHCSAAARGSISPLGISARASRRGQRGLDPAVLRTFPTFTYSEVKSHKIGKGALECAVCLNEFADEETLKLLPKCDHVFHPDCIDVWLASHSTCPVCRANLEQATETTRNVEPAPEPSVTESSGGGAISEIPELPRSASVAIAHPETIQRSKSSNRPTRSLSMKSIFFFSKFPRSNSTGHCVVEPGENIDRFTLKLPSEIRNQIMNRTLNRSVSVVVLPNESSLRKGFRTGGELWSGRGVMDRALEDRWWFGMGTGLFTRPSLNSNGGEGTSRIMEIVRQISIKGFGSRRDRSGSVKENKSTRPVV